MKHKGWQLGRDIIVGIGSGRKRATDGGERAAKATRGVIVTNTRSAEVDGSTGGSVKVIADDKPKITILDNGSVFE